MKNFKSIILGILMTSVFLISQNMQAFSNLVGVQNFSPIKYVMYFDDSGKVYPIKAGSNCDMSKENIKNLVVGNTITGIKVYPCVSTFFRDTKGDLSLVAASILLGTNNKVDDSVTKLLDNAEFKKTEEYKNLQNTVRLITKNTEKDREIRLSNDKDLNKAFNIWKIKNGYVPDEVAGTKWEFKSSFEKSPFKDAKEWLKKYLGGTIKVADPGNDKMTTWSRGNSDIKNTINVYNDPSNNNVLLTIGWNKHNEKATTPLSLSLSETQAGLGTRHAFKDVDYPSSKTPYT